MGLERDPEDLLMSSPDKQAESKSTLEPTRWRFTNHWCIVAALLTGAALTLLFIAGTTLDQETMHRRLGNEPPKQLSVVGVNDGVNEAFNGTYKWDELQGWYTQSRPENGCSIKWTADDNQDNTPPVSGWKTCRDDSVVCSMTVKVPVHLPDYVP